jgi:hypothetical protein
MRLELRLLLSCARVHLEPGRADQVRALLRHDLDWASLLRAAAGHGTTPLLYWHLNRLAPDAVPRVVLEDLRQRFLDNTGHSLLLTGELLRLLSRFAAHGIRVIPFKGPTLAACAYGHLALRQFNDLDLLVLPADLPPARKLLAAEGYRSGLPLAPAQEEAYLASICQIPFVMEDRPCMVELHTQIAPRAFHFPLGLECLWPRLRPLVLGGRPVHALAAEDLLLVLCAHGAKHLWACLGWVCDVAELLRVQEAMNWAGVVEQARSLRCERILLLGLVLAHDLLEAPVPEDLLQSARTLSVVRTLAAQVWEQMFGAANGRMAALDGALFHLRVRERLADGLRYSLSLALAPTVADWTAVRLPAPFAILYPLLRPVRLALKYSGLVPGRRRPPPGA